MGLTEPRLEWAALNVWSFNILGSNIPSVPGPIVCSSPFLQRQVVPCCRQRSLAPEFRSRGCGSHTSDATAPDCLPPDASSTTGSARPRGPIGGLLALCLDLSLTLSSSRPCSELQSPHITWCVRAGWSS